MDGRDIGTVVFPNAQLKIFMTADRNVRAARRLKELGDHYYYGRGVLQNYEKAAYCYLKIAEKAEK